MLWLPSCAVAEDRSRAALGGSPGAAVTNQLSAACFLFHSPLSYFIAFETFFFFLQRWTLPLVAMQQKNTSKLFSFLLHSLFLRSSSEGHSCVDPLCATSPLQPFSAFPSNPTHAKLFLWQPFHLIGASALSWGWFWPGTIIFSPAVWWNVFVWASPNILKHQLLSQFFFFFFLHLIHVGPAGNLTFKVKYCLISSSWADFHCPDWFRGMNKPPQLLRLHICNYLTIN